MRTKIARALVSWVALCSLTTRTLASQAQFYEKSENYGVAVSSTPDNGNADFFVQISAPVSYGWAAVGTGDKMDKALMFIVYPSGRQDDVVLSVRSTHGHDTPEPISGINATVLNSEIRNGKMAATIRWHQDSSHSYRRIDVTNTKQAWIWAVGPTNKGVGDPGSSNAAIQQHSHYGVFFVDMPFTQNALPALPTISGTSSVHAKGQPSYYTYLVYAHATLLGAAFVIVFPLGVIGLRWKWHIAFKVHWMVQIVATTAAYIGLAAAIILSIVGIEYAGFDQGHQILGLSVVALLSLQVVLGYVHHKNYKKVARRTVSSYLHIGLGRIVIYAGMINAILGALLSDETAIAAAVGGASAVLAAGLEYMAFRHRRRRRHDKVHGTSSKSSSTLALNALIPEDPPEENYEGFRPLR